MRCVEEHAYTKVLSTYTVTALTPPNCNILFMDIHLQNIPPYRKDSHESIRTATRLQAEQPWNWCSISGSSKIFFSTSRCPDRLWCPSSRLIQRYRWLPSHTLSPGGEADCSHPSGGEGMNEWSYIPFSHIPLRRVQLDLSPG